MLSTIFVSCSGMLKYILRPLFVSWPVRWPHRKNDFISPLPCTLKGETVYVCKKEVIFNSIKHKNQRVNSYCQYLDVYGFLSGLNKISSFSVKGLLCIFTDVNFLCCRYLSKTLGKYQNDFLYNLWVDMISLELIYYI